MGSGLEMLLRALKSSAPIFLTHPMEEWAYLLAYLSAQGQPTPVTVAILLLVVRLESAKMMEIGLEGLQFAVLSGAVN